MEDIAWDELVIWAINDLVFLKSQLPDWIWVQTILCPLKNYFIAFLCILFPCPANFEQNAFLFRFNPIIPTLFNYYARNRKYRVPTFYNFEKKKWWKKNINILYLNQNNCRILGHRALFHKKKVHFYGYGTRFRKNE